MASTRARLTVSYALVLLGTMLAFGASIWTERRSGVENELGREALRVADNVFFTIQSSPMRLTFDSSATSGAIFKSTKDLADVLDQATREVTRGGTAIELTPKEYTVLEYLMRHAGRVMSRTLITEYAWGYHFDPGTNIVDVVINHLRKKVDAKHQKRLITTVRGVGYMIKEASKDGKDGSSDR